MAAADRCFLPPRFFDENGEYVWTDSLYLFPDFTIVQVTVKVDRLPQKIYFKLPKPFPTTTAHGVTGIDARTVNPTWEYPGAGSLPRYLWAVTLSDKVSGSSLTVQVVSSSTASAVTFARQAWGQKFRVRVGETYRNVVVSKMEVLEHAQNT